MEGVILRVFRLMTTGGFDEEKYDEGGHYTVIVLNETDRDGHLQNGVRMRQRCF